MQDSSHDEPTVIAVLCAFVRDHAIAPPVKPAPESSHPPTDIQAALTVVVSRNPAHDGSATVLDLSNAHVTFANLRGAGLNRANLNGANLGDATLTGADLSFAYRSDAKLSDGTPLARTPARTSAELPDDDDGGAELDHGIQAEPDQRH